MNIDDPVETLRNLASALSECDECQAPTVDDTDGPNSLCGKCWAKYIALRDEVRELRAEVERLETSTIECPVCRRRVQSLIGGGGVGRIVQCQECAIRAVLEGMREFLDRWNCERWPSMTVARCHLDSLCAEHGVTLRGTDGNQG